jgi:transcription elongation factor Elf1
MDYQCFNCRHFKVIWDSDASFEDFGIDGDGVVSILHCKNCGAEIHYFMSNDKTGDSEN